VNFIAWSAKMSTTQLRGSNDSGDDDDDIEEVIEDSPSRVSLSKVGLFVKLHSTMECFAKVSPPIRILDYLHLLRDARILAKQHIEDTQGV